MRENENRTDSVYLLALASLRYDISGKINKNNILNFADRAFI